MHNATFLNKRLEYKLINLKKNIEKIKMLVFVKRLDREV